MAQNAIKQAPQFDSLFVQQTLVAPACIEIELGDSPS